VVTGAKSCPTDGDHVGYPTGGALAGVWAEFTWSTIAGAQNYYLVVGTSHYGTNLVNAGILPAGQSSYPVPALPQAGSSTPRC
jgi:hypothetical protein